MKKSYNSNCVYMIRHQASPWKRASFPSLVDGICIHNLRSEFLHFRGSCASISVLFFFNWLKISQRFHFFVLEPPYMQSKGRTMRTTVRTVRAYEYDEVPRRQTVRKTRNNPCLILKIKVF